MVKPPTRNPNGPAQSQSAPSIRPSLPNYSAPAQICRAHHTPASKFAPDNPENVPVSEPAKSIASALHHSETSLTPACLCDECPRALPTAPPIETARALRKIADGFTPARSPESRTHSSRPAEMQTSEYYFHNRK